MTQKIQSADITWTENKTPVSNQFDDVYYSTDGGAEESTYIFLQQNELPQRWLQLKPFEKFVIAETGFGTGLNFLVVSNLWKSLVIEGKIAPTAELHFISVEKYPLKLAELKICWEQWPEFQSLTEQLANRYPIHSPGFHQIDLDNIYLTLGFGDAIELYSDLVAQVDCWFLDGFMPSKNPDMWQPPLYHAMANLSHPSTTFATFTSARIVKDGLLQAGFSVHKVSGFGKKREMFAGKYQTLGPMKPVNKTPWFRYTNNKDKANSECKVAVIGAGIAGSSTARALVKKGFDVDIIEQMDYSQGPPPISIQGVLYVKLSTKLTPQSSFYSQGFIKSLDTLNLLPDVEWKKTGVIQTAFSEAEAKRQVKFLSDNCFPDELIKGVTAEEASELAGVEIAQSGLHFPSGAWINPISLCQQLIQGINLIHNTRVDRITANGAQWDLETSQGKLGSYDQVVIACSNSAPKFEQITDHLPVKSIRGQKSFIKLAEDNFPLKTVLCSNAYIVPSVHQQINFGATFNLNDDNPNARDSDHDTNRSHITENFPTLRPWLEQPISMGIVGFRCTSPDYMPIVGAIPDWQKFTDQYKNLSRFKKQHYADAPLLNGLYCNLAHGSRGLASVFLSAEFLASQIAGTPLPVSKTVADHLNPARFLVKKLKQSKI